MASAASRPVESQGWSRRTLSGKRSATITHFGCSLAAACECRSRHRTIVPMTAVGCSCDARTSHICKNYFQHSTWHLLRGVRAPQQRMIAVTVFLFRRAMSGRIEEIQNVERRYECRASIAEKSRLSHYRIDDHARTHVHKPTPHFDQSRITAAPKSFRKFRPSTRRRSELNVCEEVRHRRQQPVGSAT